MTDQMTKMWQAQFTLERTNGQYYCALESAAEVVNRPGAAAYFHSCARDERHHARRVRDYIVDRGGSPAFDAIPAIPEIDGTNYAGLFKFAQSREQITTQALTNLWLAADDQDTDPQSVSAVQNSHGDWIGFLDEQTQSERELADHLMKINRLQPDGIELFDQWLAGQYGKD